MEIIMLEIIEQSESLANLFAALSVAQGAFTFASKDATAVVTGRTTRKYATLQSTIACTRKPLTENGLCVLQFPCNCENDLSKVCIITYLGHKSGEFIRARFVLPIDRMGGIQGLGSAITYARRYALQAILGISADEDDDGEAAQQEYRQSQTSRYNQQYPQRQQTTSPAHTNEQPQNNVALRKKMFALLNKCGFSERESALEFINSQLGTSITSTNDLSDADVSNLINNVLIPMEQTLATPQKEAVNE